MNDIVQLNVGVSSNLPDFSRAAAALPRELSARLQEGMGLANQRVIAVTVKRRFSGQGPFPAQQNRLGNKSNLLRRSIRSTSPQIRDGKVTSKMGSNVPYFGIHEFGGETKPRIIRAKNGGALAFNIGGATILVKSVNHPGSKFPARAPLATGIAESDEIYQKRFDKAVAETLAEII